MVTFRTNKDDSLRELTAYLRSVNPNCNFRSVIICILLLREGNLLEDMAGAL